MNNCNTCGKFVGYTTGDCGTRYGCADPGDPEPYDPEFWCKKCADKKYIESLEKGKKMYLYWCMPNWQIRALETLGLKKENHKIVKI